MMDCVLSGSLLVVFSLFCYAMCVFFRANKLSLSHCFTLLILRDQPSSRFHGRDIFREIGLLP